MKINTVNISFNQNLLLQIDKVAQEESRSRSELIREAARQYIERKKNWKTIFAFGRRQIEALSLKKADVAVAIRAYRQNKK